MPVNDPDHDRLLRNIRRLKAGGNPFGPEGRAIRAEEERDTWMNRYIKLRGERRTQADLPITKLLKLCHPDRHTNATEELRALANEMTQWLLEQR